MISRKENYRLIAIKVGDFLKYDAHLKPINRAAKVFFRFEKQHFPNEDISSERAQLIHDWVLSLAKQEMVPDQRHELLTQFLNEITPEHLVDEVRQIVDEGLGRTNEVKTAEVKEFSKRGFHIEIIKHCRKLYMQGNYFHAVFEACKVYNKSVREKSRSTKDGQPLMLEVWGWEKGVLKVTKCETDTDKNIQDGIRFLSAGLMQAMRNPTAHEPALDWPIEKQDCLDMLSFLSFLFRELDKAIYYKS